MVKRFPMILIDRSINAGIVGFRGSTQPTGGNPTISDNQNLDPAIGVPRGLWKVILSEDRTQPNDPNLFDRFGFYVGNDKRDNKWYDSPFLYSIGNLENQLNTPSSLKYDFLNNLSPERAAVIKTGGVVKGLINGNESTINLPVSLLADTLSSPMTYGEKSDLNQLSSIKAVVGTTSIESDVPESSGFIENNIGEITTNDNSLTLQAKPNHVSTSKIDVFDAGTPYSISQISSSQYGTIKTSIDTRFGQVDIAQIDSAHKVVSMQSSHETGAIFDVREIDYFSSRSLIDNKIGKVSLPSSVSSHQSFNVDSLLIGHDNTSFLTNLSCYP